MSFFIKLILTHFILVDYSHIFLLYSRVCINSSIFNKFYSHFSNSSNNRKRNWN